MTKVETLVTLFDSEIEVRRECSIEYLMGMRRAAMRAVEEYNQSVWDCRIKP